MLARQPLPRRDEAKIQKRKMVVCACLLGVGETNNPGNEQIGPNDLIIIIIIIIVIIIYAFSIGDYMCSNYNQ